MIVTERTLHVFANDVEWVVAYDIEDAKAIVREFIGLSDEDMQFDAWGQESDDEYMRIWIDNETGEVGEGCGCTLVNGRMDAWAEAFGRGYLCTSEY